MVEPTSEISTSSSPRNTDNAVFSDTPFRASSPPSSPPGFPWEQSQHPGPHLRPSQKKTVSPPRPNITAFSVLGKRKALESTSPNPRRLKKLPPTAHTPDGRTTGSKPSHLTQLQISLGQAVRKTCQVCGMEYVPSTPEDAKLHARFHQQALAGVPVARTFVARTAADKRFPGVRQHPPPRRPVAETREYGRKGEETEADAVVRVDSRDSSARKAKAQMVLEAVQRELGAVPLNEGEVWGTQDGETSETEMRFWAYVYIRENKCVGFLLVERISEAFTVAGPEGSKVEGKRKERSREEGKTTSALEALQARKLAAVTAKAEMDRRPVELSKTKVPVRLGVSRIWTLSACRGAEIATTLLDTAVIDGKLRRKTDVAFSQPTQAGAKLARRWMDQAYGWCVYA